MMVYAVFKCGVYRHECGGVFSTLEAAECAAERCIAGEKDDHHAYEVVPFALDVATPQTPLEAKVGFKGISYNVGGELEEPASLCDWTRDKTVISKTPNAELCGARAT